MVKSLLRDGEEICASFHLNSPLFCGLLILCVSLSSSYCLPHTHTPLAFISVHPSLSRSLPCCFHPAAPRPAARSVAGSPTIAHAASAQALNQQPIAAQPAQPISNQPAVTHAPSVFTVLGQDLELLPGEMPKFEVPDVVWFVGNTKHLADIGIYKQPPAASVG